MIEPSPTIHALVPLKLRGTAKSRLSADLGPADRAALIRRMLGRVIDACVRSAHVSGVSIVADADPSCLDGLPGQAALLVQPSADIGLNAGLAWALDRIAADGAGVAIIMADLPALTGAALDDALGCLPDGRSALIVPDQHGTGTSMLAWRGGSFRGLTYGDGSRRRHARALHQDGFMTVECPGIPAFADLDVAEDARCHGWPAMARPQMERAA